MNATLHDLEAPDILKHLQGQEFDKARCSLLDAYSVSDSTAPLACVYFITFNALCKYSECEPDMIIGITLNSVCSDVSHIRLFWTLEVCYCHVMSKWVNMNMGSN